MKENLEGKTIGNLYVILQYQTNKNRDFVRCECVCRCGKLVSLTYGDLTTEGKKSCGCRYSIEYKLPSLIGKITEYGFRIDALIKTGTSHERKWRLKCLKCDSPKISSEQNLLKSKICDNCTGLYGKKIGRWTVLNTPKIILDNYTFYECQCDCGNKKIVRATSLRNSCSKSCGCIYKEISKERSKKSGYDKKSKRILDSTLWKNLVRYIKNRDNHICYICESNDYLNIHHMDGWKNFKELRYEETNLITLCNFCHDDFHMKHGKNFVTKEMFLDYISGFEYPEDFLDRLYQYKKLNGFSYVPKNNFME